VIVPYCETVIRSAPHQTARTDRACGEGKKVRHVRAHFAHVLDPSTLLVAPASGLDAIAASRPARRTGRAATFGNARSTARIVRAPMNRQTPHRRQGRRTHGTAESSAPGPSHTL
jgi:hypothetical protein